MGELSIHRWKGFELYPVINKKTVKSFGQGVPIGCFSTTFGNCLVLFWGDHLPICLPKVCVELSLVSPNFG
jgi:hypothetical protein